MITVKNYQDQKNNVAWSKMPKAVQDTRTDVEEIMEFYDDDPGIKETVDIFLGLINDNSKPVGEIIFAKVPKVDVVEPKKDKEIAIFMYFDDWNRGVYKNGNKFFVDVDGVLHDMTSSGEPNTPFKNLEFVRKFKEQGKKAPAKTKVSNLAEFKKFLKDNIGKTLYLDSNYRGEKRKEIRIIEKVQSNSVAFKKAPDTKANNLSWLDYGKAANWTFSNYGAMFRDEHVTLIYYYETPDDWETMPVYNKPEPVKEKEPTIRETMAATKHLKYVMISLQQNALFELEKSEEKQFFIDKIKELDQILVDATKIDDVTPIMDKIVKMHFFYGGSDWYIFDYTPKDKVFFGYAILNGDTQMSEAGYISVDDLKSIRGIEMDFYFDQKELGKILHSQYPDEFDEYQPKSNTPAPKSQSKDIYLVKDGKVLTNHGMKEFWFTDNPQFAHRIEDIEFANRMKANYDAQIVFGFDLMKSEVENYVAPKAKAPAKTKAPTKKKVAKVIDKTIVDNLSPEFLLIRRFWNIIKTESVHVPFRTVQLLYMAFNKAAVERKVRKASEAAELFTACNKKIITLFEDIPNDDKKPYEIEFTDKKLYNQIKEYVQDVAVNPAIPLLKRFIAMQNTSADKTKAKTLQKSIVKLMETDNFEKNRLFKEIQTAEFELNDYILNNSKLEPTIYGLSRPATRSMCTNRVKCTGIDKTGKLHKGYKFQEHTGNVIKVRKGKLGSPNVCENRVKCTGLSKNGKLLKGYKFQEGTNKVIKVRKTATRKATAKKPVAKKKKLVAGLGFSDNVEKIYGNTAVIPINPVIYTPDPEPTPEPVAQTAPQEQPKPVVKNKLMNMQFDSLNMDEGWENFMQNPAKNMRMAIWGAPKNGKTAGALQLANYLSKFGKVLYNFADQGFNKSTQDLWQMSGLANNAKAEPSDVQTLDDLEKEVATGKYTFVFIDMISDYINKEGIKPYEFKERFMKKYPKVSFILVFEVTKGGNFKGDQGWTHIVDAIVTVEDFLMENRGRYGVGSHIVWEDGLKRFNPKRYSEVMEDLNPVEFSEVERI